VITEAEFLARRESVERVMVVRQAGSRTQIAVLEDDVLVEHYVAQAAQTSSVGNVYLGKVQNVLPAMEAAFIDIGKGRNAVLYAGEVAWSRMGMDGKARRMETALSSGQSILVQVTKDPVGNKGARLTGLVSLPGRFLVYAPGGSMSGISRKLPETERARLKSIVKKVFSDEASVIIRTAAEGATEDELNHDIHRLEAQWLDIEAQAKTATAPARLYAEPDLAIKVVRDMFNEDFASLVIAGDEAWQTLHSYVSQVAPDLVDRLSHWTAEDDVFAAYRVDEQIAKALDRKVWLPSGGSLVIDRTEAMTVIDVNTGKFTGSGGNLEATVTKNNLEAAEEVVRQIRLRDIGGIIVIDFIDMVLENNRDLVLRRVVECLGRDRTRHQVAEVTSLGLVQMTRKRVGQGLLDVFSEPCEHCNGRGVKIYYEPIESVSGEQHEQTPQPGRAARGDQSSRRSRRGASAAPEAPPRQSPAEVIRAVAMAAANSHRSAEADMEGDPELPDSASIDDDVAALALDQVELFEVGGDVAADWIGDAPKAGAESPTADWVGADATEDDSSRTEVVADADPARVDNPADAQPSISPNAEPSLLDGPEQVDPAPDAPATEDVEVTDTESPESGHAPARRARRTRSTRRPAGPPRPVLDAPAGPPVLGDRPSTGSAVESTGKASGTGDRISEHPHAPVSGPAAGEVDGPGEGRAAPRRRRATRPAGAPTT